MYTVVTTPMVQLSLRLAVPIEDFYSPDDIVSNIATLLKVGLCAWWQLPR